MPAEHGRIGFGARAATPIGLRNDEAMTPRGYRARHDHPWSTASAHDCSSRAPLSTSASLRHRHPEFIRFLKKIDNETPTDFVLHLIVDDDGTHTHAAVKRGLKRHPRIYLQFTPTSSSWLNLVERWFRAFTDKRIRRDSFDSVSDLIATVEDDIVKSNLNPLVFFWTASVEKILAKIACMAPAGAALTVRTARGAMALTRGFLLP